MTNTNKKWRVGSIDDSVTWLKYLSKLYERYSNVELDTYHYPEDNDKFNQNAHNSDILLVDLFLGGTNGANVIRNLFKDNVEAKMIILTAYENPDICYDRLSIYLKKHDLIANPDIIFEANKSSDIDIAVESVYLAKAIKAEMMVSAVTALVEV